MDPFDWSLVTPPPPEPSEFSLNFTLPGTNIPVVNQTLKKSIKKSVFHVIVSSNVRADRYFSERNDPIGYKLKLASDWLFGRSWRNTQKNYLDIYDIVSGPRGNSQKTGAHPRRQQIHSIQWEGGEMQVGEKKKGRRIHLGGDLTVYHYTKLRVNVKRCQQYLNYLLTFEKDQDIQNKPPSGERVQSAAIKGTYVHATNTRDRITNFLYDNRYRIRRIIENL